jgi:hypothetical protein
MGLYLLKSLTPSWLRPFIQEEKVTYIYSEPVCAHTHRHTQTHTHTHTSEDTTNK